MAPTSASSALSAHPSQPLGQSKPSTSPGQQLKSSAGRRQPLEVKIPANSPGPSSDSLDSPSQPSARASAAASSPFAVSANSSYPPKGFQALDRRRKTDSSQSPTTAHGPAGARASAYEADVLEGIDASTSLLSQKMSEKDSASSRNGPHASSPVLGRSQSPRRRNTAQAYAGRSTSGRGPPGGFGSVFAHFAGALAGRRIRVLVLALGLLLVTIIVSSGGDLNKVGLPLGEGEGISKVQEAWAWAESRRKGVKDAALALVDKVKSSHYVPGAKPPTDDVLADEIDDAVQLEQKLKQLEDALEEEVAVGGSGRNPAADAGSPHREAIADAEDDLDFEIPPAAPLPNVDVDDEDDGDELTGGGKGQGNRPGAKTPGGSAQAATKGGDGSVIRLDDGSSFTYRNSFGGHWDSDPLSVSAQAQSFTPPLGKPWDYSSMTISGVNLGGWLTLEPFITPYLYEPFENAAVPAWDEWTLSVNYGKNLPRVLENHYKTFITEKDFAQIAAAGLNWVRLPLPYWAIDARPEEPFLAHVAWKYFIKAMGWARKYGIRVNLDLHTVPGSQNGWNHSGRVGSINFLNGVMGLANAQRTMSIIRALAEFSALPGNRDVITMFSVVNEPFWIEIGDEPLRNFYYNVYNQIRDVTGLGAGKGPMLAIHDGFHGTSRWFDFLRGGDRVGLDSHRYLCFMPPNNDPLDEQAIKPCQRWGHEFNRTMSGWGLAISGEWSIAVNDCGRYLNAVNAGARFDGSFPNASAPQYPAVGSCDGWEDYDSWPQEMKEGLLKVALAHMDTFQNWFYWTWKTGKTLTTGRIANPLWSYSLGVEKGWLPKDPRVYKGICRDIAASASTTFKSAKRTSTKLLSWQTGGAGAGVLKKADAARYAWPPELTSGLVAAHLPQYTQTGRPIVLFGGPTPTPTRMAVANKGVGVEAPRKTGPAFVPIRGCDYPEPWSGVGAEVPNGAKCGAVHPAETEDEMEKI